MVSDIPAGDGKMANLLLQCLIAALHYKCRKNLRITREYEHVNRMRYVLTSHSNFIVFFLDYVLYVDFEGNVSLGFSNLYFCLFKWIALQERLFFFGQNVKDTTYGPE